MCIRDSYVATLLARRLYYTTSYLVDLQQQSEGKREDLDLVDKILAQLVEKPNEAKHAKGCLLYTSRCV